MNLTEPQAGCDVGALTRAMPADDGSWRITRSEDLHHLRRAGPHRQHRRTSCSPACPTPRRAPGASRCFIVPKVLRGLRRAQRGAVHRHRAQDGHPRAARPARWSTTDAVGYLIGEPNAGMRYMFTMMNNARLSVGLEGLVLGRAGLPGGGRPTPGADPGAAHRTRPQGQASPIVEHADIRRMLLHMRSHIEAMRGLAYTNARAIDLAKHGADEDARIRRTSSPTSSPRSPRRGAPTSAPSSPGSPPRSTAAWATSARPASSSTSANIRIAAIYEGTNGIQAMDLVGRKLPMRWAAWSSTRSPPIEATAAELLSTATSPGSARPSPTPSPRCGRRPIGSWPRASRIRRTRWPAPRPTSGCSARCSAGGSSPARPSPAAARFDDDYHAAKVVTARYYVEQVLPTSARARAGGDRRSRRPARDPDERPARALIRLAGLARRGGGRSRCDSPGTVATSRRYGWWLAEERRAGPRRVGEQVLARRRRWRRCAAGRGAGVGEELG